MSAVNTDPKDLRKLAQDIKRAQTEITQSIGRVKGALGQARWDDPVRKKFEQQLSEMESAISRFGKTAEESNRYLTQKASQLETFLRA